MEWRLYVDQEKCIGCGLCPEVAPGVFRMNEEGVSVVANPAGAEESEIHEALDECPVKCIHWKDK